MAGNTLLCIYQALVLYLTKSLNELAIIFACMISFHNIMIYLQVFKVHRFLLLNWVTNFATCL